MCLRIMINPIFGKLRRSMHPQVLGGIFTQSYVSEGSSLTPENGLKVEKP